MEIAEECKLSVAKMVGGQNASEVNVLSAAGNFLQIGHGSVDEDVIMVNGNVKTFPAKETGSDSLSCRDFTTGENSVTISGGLLLSQEHDCPVHKEFSLTFTARDEHGLMFEANIPGAHSEAIKSNYIAMNFDSPLDEEIYGMGLQYTVWDFKGHQVPLISDEAGVGRGLQPITAIMNITQDG